MSSTAHHSLIALCRAGKLKEALHILLTTLNPPKDYHVYLQLLQTCILKNALSEGKNVHSFIAHRRFSLAHLTDLYNRLIYLYVKCESLEDARKVFDQMKKRYIFSWNTIVAAYGRHGYSHEAVTLFHEMLRAGFQPNEFTLANVLGACAKIGGLEQGMGIHKRIMAGGFLSDDVVATALVDMYAKCGNIDKARELFDTMPQRDVASWNAMIAGYLQNGCVEKALETFKQMQLAGVKPYSTTSTSMVAACAKTRDLEQGIDIHQIIKDRGLSSDVRVATALVDMYAKCGNIEKARELFDTMPQRNVVSWNAMIAGYLQNGFVEKALETFEQMQLAGVKPDSWTFASILAACANAGDLEQGMDIHQIIKDRGLSSDVRVATALIGMYAKCGRLARARELFEKMPERNVVSWTAMIAGYVLNGFVHSARIVFKKMQLAGVKPNVVSWSAMIVGYAQKGSVRRALRALKRMELAGIKADSTIFASIVTACAKRAAWKQGIAKTRVLKQGMEIHQRIEDGGIMGDVRVATALVDMYAKCGRIDRARKLFDTMPQRNVVSWAAMIAGYAENGFVENALETLEQMQLAGVNPNSKTFCSILPACVRALKQGMKFEHSSKHNG